MTGVLLRWDLLVAELQSPDRFLYQVAVLQQVLHQEVGLGGDILLLLLNQVAGRAGQRVVRRVVRRVVLIFEYGRRAVGGETVVAVQVTSRRVVRFEFQMLAQALNQFVDRVLAVDR